MTLRILLPHQLDSKNIYVSELANAYDRAGCEVIFGVDNLLAGNLKIDIIHLHWPEAFYRWSGWGTVEKRAERFITSLTAYKKKGVKIVWTIHNLTPHDFAKPGIDFDTYQSVLNLVDLVHHHCPKSMNLLDTTYNVPSNIPAIVVPHGHYQGYPSDISQKEARGQLKIPNDAYVYLFFGAIRSYKGLDTLLANFRKIKHPKKWLLIAGDYKEGTGKGAFREKLRLTVAQHLSPRTTLHLQSIPSEEIQKFLTASDALVLSHARGLNSGVAVLGMTFGKLVIGPKLGCIEWVLSSGENIVYDINSSSSLVKAMNQAPTMNKNDIHKINTSVSENWSWDSIANNVITHPILSTTIDH